MKTIIFSTDEKLIEDCRKQGEIIVAKDPVKTLQAMKKLGTRDDYKVVGDDKYVEVAKKLGYNKDGIEVKEKEITDEDLVKLVGELTTKHEIQLKKKAINYSNELTKLKSEYEQKIKELEQEKITAKKEFDEKVSRLEKEKNEIKDTIKKIVYEAD